MAIILDADVIIQGEKGAFDLSGWLALHQADHFEMAAITVAELWHGVEWATGGHRALRERFLNAVVERVSVIPYTEQTARLHARIWAELEAAGKRIGAYDLIVGATAVERGCQVATFNKRHFAQIKGLRVIEPE
jgi:predicted nucleic acid-binding protein